MHVVTVCLSPEEMEDDPNLMSFAVEDTSKESIKEAICSRYDVDGDTFHYWEYSSSLPNGSFETVESEDFEDFEDDVLRIAWVFEVFEV